MRWGKIGPRMDISEWKVVLASMQRDEDRLYSAGNVSAASYIALIRTRLEAKVGLEELYDNLYPGS